MQDQTTWKKYKTPLLAISSIIGVALIIFVVYKYIRLPFYKVCAYEAVPTNAALILEFNQLDSIQAKVSRTNFKETLKEMDFVQKIQRDVADIDTLFFQNESFKNDMFKNCRILAALQVNGSKGFDYIYIVEQYKKVFKEELLDELTSKGHKVDFSTFQDEKVYQIKLKNGRSFALSTFKNLILVGRRSFLVEDAINQVHQYHNSYARESSLQQLEAQLNDDSHLAIYCKPENMNFLLSNIIKNDKKRAINTIGNAIDWIGLNIDLSAQHIKLRGRLFPNTGHRFFTTLNLQNRGGVFEMTKVLPNNSAVLAFYSIDNIKAFGIDVGIHHKSDFANYIIPWAANNFASVLYEPTSTNYDSEKCIVFKAKDIEFASDLLAEFAETAGILDTVEYQTYQLKRLLAVNLFKGILGEEQGSLQKPYYTIIDDYVIFANSETTLKVWIDKYIIGETLNREPDFLAFQQQFPSNIQAFYYINPTILLQLYKAYLKEMSLEALTELLAPYQKFNTIGFALQSSDKGFFIKGNIQYIPSSIKKETSIIWRTDLQSNASIPPKVVKNIKTKEYEIFIQDEQSNIYLIGNGGKIKWKKYLESPIISDIYQIDYFKNGQLQFLFNTKENIHLLDYNGNPLPNFPIKLSSHATNGLLLVDYFNDKDYSYYVACKNKNIYGYKKDGRPIQGWNPNLRVGEIEQPLQHVLLNRKDYVVALDKNGKINFFTRQGEKHFPSVKLKTTTNSKFGIDISTSPYQRVVVAGKEGKARVINFAGKKFNLGISPKKRENVKFAYADIVGDQRKDYITLSGKHLSVYYYDENNKFKEYFSYIFEENQDNVFAVKPKGSLKSYIATYNASKHKIYLMDNKGQLYPDFPLAGTGEFEVGDLFREGRNTLVVADGAGVYAYKLK